jgi:RluA family pseudouridine synthase
MKSLEILFEDHCLIAIDKPAGLLSHASPDRSRPDALTMLTKQLRERDGSAPLLSLAHRLDRDTSGVLLFAKDPAWFEAVSLLFRERKIQKTYLGLASKKPARAEWTLKNYLAEEKYPSQKTPRTVAVRSGGDVAETHFQVIKETKDLFLIRARPLTGRRHQIRTHLADSGCPLIGDSLYGGLRGTRVLLHAWALEFIHPETQQPLRIESSIPSDFPLRWRDSDAQQMAPTNSSHKLP